MKISTVASGLLSILALGAISVLASASEPKGPIITSQVYFDMVSALSRQSYVLHNIHTATGTRRQAFGQNCHGYVLHLLH